MERRYEILTKLYWKLWTSADFTSDFQRDFFPVCQNMELGNHYSIPMITLEECWNYLQDWDKKYF